MVSGTAVPGAAVFVESENQGTLADSLGSFVAADVPPGPQLITVKQIGYHDKVIAFTATGRPEDVVEIPLAPKPFMLDGITAVASNIETMEDRMRSRRGAASVGRGLIRAYDREALLASGAGAHRAQAAGSDSRAPLALGTQTPIRPLTARPGLYNGVPP